MASILALTICAGLSLTQNCHAGPAEPTSGDGASHFTDPLPLDSALVTGQLRNGLRYVLLPMPESTNELGFRLFVRAGTVHESDDQRGAAALAAKVALAAPVHSIKRLRGLGVQPSEDIRSFTTFDHTAFTLMIDRADEYALRAGLGLLADIADGVVFDRALLDSERANLLMEERRRTGLTQRLTLALVPRIVEGCLFSRRLPFGLEREIASLNEQRLRTYLEQHYVPGNMTLLIAGGADPEATVQTIEAYFGHMTDQAPPPAPDPELAGRHEPLSVLVARDAELSTCVVELLHMDVAPPPMILEQDLRARLVDQLAAESFERRLRVHMAEGNAVYDDADVGIDGADPLAQRSHASVYGPAPLWNILLEQFVVELERARRFGFTQQELTVARQSILSDCKRAIRTQSHWSPEEAIDGLSMLALRGDIMLSRANRYTLYRSLLHDIKPPEVTIAMRRLFSKRNSALIVFLPDEGALPNDAAIVQAANRALALPVSPLGQEVPQYDRALLPEHPEPGDIVEMTIHRPSGVRSVWMNNGIRVHHLKQSARPDDVCVEVSICGGRSEENRRTHGLTLASGVVWERPATAFASGQAIADMLLGHEVSLTGRIEEDRIALRMLAHRDDVRLGMELLHGMLTEPRIEYASFDRWRLATASDAEAREVNTIQSMNKALVDTLYPADDVRHRPLEPDEVRAITARDAQRWLDNLLAHAPIEIAIVGDIEVGEALELARQYFGSLNDRSRPDSARFAITRSIEPTVGQIDRSIELDSPTRNSVALIGFRTRGASNAETELTFSVAAEILTARLTHAVRKEQQIAADVRAVHYANQAHPEIGVFCAPVICEAEDIEQAVCEVQEQIETFAADGPTHIEFQHVIERQASESRKQILDPAVWSQWLSTLSLRNRTIDDLMNRESLYRSLTREGILDVFRTYAADEASSVRIVVTPRPCGDGPDAPDGMDTHPGATR